MSPVAHATRLQLWLQPAVPGTTHLGSRRAHLQSAGLPARRPAARSQALAYFSCHSTSCLLSPAQQRCSQQRPGSWPLRPAQRSRGSTACRAGDQGVSAFEPEVLPPSVPRGSRLETSRVNAEVLRRVEVAVEAAGGTVTVGDVAAAAGVKLGQAEEALNALAADTLGTLKVSDEGDVLYVIPRNFRTALATRSLAARLRPVLAGAKEAAAYVVRVAFGTALISSVVLVWVTIIALLTASSRDNDDRGRGRSNSYGYSSGFASRGPSIWFNFSDVLWYLDPWYYRRRRLQREAGQQMGFVEAIFSFVFGDGDPNLTYEERRWQLVGQYIQHKGGVVTAEQLAPFLDPPAPSDSASSSSGGSALVDEGFVVPALVRFGGSPEVDERGGLVYRFPSLQKTAAKRAPPPERGAALEATWDFTGASPGQRTGAAALGAANLLGVAVLGGLLRDPQVVYTLSRSSLAFVGSAMPALQLYAAAFFAIPAVRWFLNRRRNAQIEKRNEARRAALARLSAPDPTLRAKLAAADRQAKRKVIREEDIVYRSDRELGAAAQGRDHEAEDFERRLAELDRVDRRLQPDKARQRQRERELEW